MDAIIYFFSNLIVLNLLLVLISFTLGWYFSKLKFTRLGAKYDDLQLEHHKLKSKIDFIEKQVNESEASETSK